MPASGARLIKRRLERIVERPQPDLITSSERKCAVTVDPNPGWAGVDGCAGDLRD